MTKRARDCGLSPFFLTAFYKTDTMYGSVKAPPFLEEETEGVWIVAWIG